MAAKLEYTLLKETENPKGALHHTINLGLLAGYYFDYFGAFSKMSCFDSQAKWRVMKTSSRYQN